MAITTDTEPAVTIDRSRLKKETITDAVIRLAGDSQDGIQSIGAFLARLAGRSDQDVMTYMTIPSTIAGGPSIFQVRMGSGEVLSAGDVSDFLIAFYQCSGRYFELNSLFPVVFLLPLMFGLVLSEAQCPHV